MSISSTIIILVMTNLQKMFYIILNNGDKGMISGKLWVRI